MGTYCTTTSLETLMVGTTFDSLTTALASKCVDFAESEANKYLGKRYNIASWDSAGSTPPMVRTLCEWLGMGYTYISMDRGKDRVDKRGEKFIELAKENLKDIAEYKADLFDTSGSLVTDISTTSIRILSNTDSYTNTFDEDNPLNWAVDSDKLDDIDDERD